MLSERYPGMAETETSAAGRLIIRRIYPFRAGRSRKDLLSYGLYLWQNLAFLGLLWWIHRLRADVVLIHSSFHNKPSTMGAVLRIARRLFGERTQFIADVRDPMLPLRRFSELHPYDAIICCSKSVLCHLEQGGSPGPKLMHIPIPHEPLSITMEDAEEAIRRYGLVGRRFIFSPNGLRLDKGIEPIIEATRMLNEQGLDVLLVIAGRERDHSVAIDTARQAGFLHFLGPIHPDDVHRLNMSAWAVVNVSPIEGMPRSALEALDLGAHILLPPNVPEFELYCPASVCRELDPIGLADQLRRIAVAQPASYPIHQHYPDKVMMQYRELVDRLLAIQDLTEKACFM